jgi:diacylglycerol O-acyltransferase / wax synthase
MEQLSGQDASFVYLDTPSTPMHIGSVGIYDPSTAPGGFVRFKDILAHIESRLDKARSFRQKLVRVPFDLDHPYWIDDPNFDLEYHVRHIALPQPGDWRQLCIQVARLHARGMDLTKPLWEFNIVEGLDNIPGIPKGSFALVAKVHHAAIDGMSGVELSAAVHDIEPKPVERTAKSSWKGENEPAITEMLMRTWVNSVTQPVKFAKTLAQTVPGAARLISQVAGGDVSLKGAKMAPQTLLNAKVGPHRVWDGTVFQLSDIRAIKDRVEGATVNDVILTIIGGGLRKYLLQRKNLPKESLTAMAPISVRADGEKEALGNLVSAMLVQLGTDIDNPMERLRFVRDTTVNSKAMTNAVGARTLTDYSQFLPSALAGLAARLYSRLGAANLHSPVFNVVATNVPGPRVPLYFAGAKMVRMMGTGPIFDGMGMINAIYSYGPDIAITFTSDRDMVPDPANYAQALRDAFEELLNAKAKAAPTPGKKVPEAKTKTASVKISAIRKAAPEKPAKTKSPAKEPAVKKPTVKKPAAKKPKAK